MNTDAQFKFTSSLLDYVASAAFETTADLYCRREGEKEGGREGRRERRKEGEKEGGREGGRERGREGEKEGEGGRERGVKDKGTQLTLKHHCYMTFSPFFHVSNSEVARQKVTLTQFRRKSCPGWDSNPLHSVVQAEHLYT